jgi:protein involved in polysaccharide export with SLBB domain
MKCLLRMIRHRTLQSWVFMIAAAFLLNACASSPAFPPSGDMNASAYDYRLGPGDKVNIKVYGDESLSGSFQVDGNGNFTFPLVGNVQANGVSKADLETALRSKLQTYLNDPRVSVEIESYRPFYIIGEVQKPGSYPYVSGMTVINAVAIAGGFTYRAKNDAFPIRRGDRSTMEGNPATQIQPGDVIVVRERFF